MYFTILSSMQHVRGLQALCCSINLTFWCVQALRGLTTNGIVSYRNSWRYYRRLVYSDNVDNNRLIWRPRREGQCLCKVQSDSNQSLQIGFALKLTVLRTHITNSASTQPFILCWTVKWVSDFKVIMINVEDWYSRGLTAKSFGLFWGLAWVCVHPLNRMLCDCTVLITANYSCWWWCWLVVVFIKLCGWCICLFLCISCWRHKQFDVVYLYYTFTELNMPRDDYYFFLQNSTKLRLLT